MGNQDGNQEAPNKDNPQAGSPQAINADELAAAHERLKQQYAGSTQEAERLKARYEKAVDLEVDRVAKDNAYLLELSEKDPDLAKDVAKKGWNLALDKALEQVKLAPTTSKKDENPLDKETLYKEFAERLMKDITSKGAHKEATDLLSTLSGEQKEVAENLYKELTNGRDLTSEEAKKFAEMATLYTNKDKIVSGKTDLNIAMFGSTGSLGRSSSQPAPEDKESGRDLAEALGLGHLYPKK